MLNKVLVVAAGVMLADILKSLADKIAKFISKNLTKKTNLKY